MKKLLVAVALLSLALPALAQQYDLLIRNGRVLDGTGNPWFSADVGILADRIAFIGKAGAEVQSKRTIDAKGLVVAPGFIDMLGQSELNLLIDKQAFSKITQGVTSEITGEGGSIAPQTEATINEMKDLLEHYHLTADWHSLDEYFARLEKQGSGVNVGTYVGAAQVRDVVIGNENRAPSTEELATMQEKVEDAMQMGALGVSSALIYAPGNYAKTDELLALAKVAARYGGTYASHIRSEGDSEAQALEEAFRIGREAGLPVEIFHLKVSGKQNWGHMRDVVNMIDQARATGIDVTADQYPYLAGATALSSTIPPQYHAGGADVMITKLKDPAVRAEIRRAVETTKTDFENWWRLAGPDGIMVNFVLNLALKQFEGKRIAEIARMQNKDPLDALIDIVITDHDNTSAIYFMINEDDMKLAMKQPWTSVGTDYGEVSPTGPLSEGRPHPRAYGTFPRILGKYVREQHVLTLEDAIRKFTSLAAQRVRLRERGELKSGYFADITIFDPQRVDDLATYDNPAQPSVGIEYVFVNGVLELEHGKPTGQVGGRPLRGPGYRGPSSGQTGSGQVSGFVTDDGGWPLGRVQLQLRDATGGAIRITETRYDGKFAIPLDTACEHCTLSAERIGFSTQRRAVNYNGANTLWFSFALQRE